MARNVLGLLASAIACFSIGVLLFEVQCISFCDWSWICLRAYRSYARFCERTKVFFWLLLRSIFHKKICPGALWLFIQQPVSRWIRSWLRLLRPEFDYLSTRWCMKPVPSGGGLWLIQLLTRQFLTSKLTCDPEKSDVRLLLVIKNMESIHGRDFLPSYLWSLLLVCPKANHFWLSQAPSLWQARKTVQATQRLRLGLSHSAKSLCALSQPGLDR